MTPRLASRTATRYKFRINFFDEPNLRHVRQVLFLLFLASQTAGGSRGLMAREAQPKFPKNRRRTRRFFFALRQPVAAAAVPRPRSTPLNCLNR
ncbi:hypothetical protein Bamb_0631 [Burkholderia ambifaria AMMD]|uniref:Uncharacterized protein n=1 Tax=Burkholderia ambifaria (strain ATCC BAA-244 / DSM 16087 / CCUG 44356 / LMG 19182 / AMMD) TaxID=339670 RepID=Q0BI33_BURCM|nr:hypothetical protein Bamb_0631 [Burkholderia ambifaria AMMD]